MLNQLTTKALELLKDNPIGAPALNMLRRMKPARQVEAAEFMVSTRNFSRSFAQALLFATRPGDRTTWRAKPARGLSQKQKVEIQNELECLLNEFGVTESYGADVLTFVVASGYVSKLIGNKQIESYLGRHHPDTLEEFRAIISAAQLDPASVEGGAAPN